MKTHLLLYVSKIEVTIFSEKSYISFLLLGHRVYLRANMIIMRGTRYVLINESYLFRGFFWHAILQQI